MVNYGPSKGCWTCRQRRVRCDLAKPDCQRCIRKGQVCGGYQPKTQPRIRFKDQTAKFQPSASTEQCDALLRNHGAFVSNQSIPAWLPPSEDDFATHFFLKFIAGLGRSQQSTEGFLELVPGYYAVGKKDSVFNMVLLAVATRFWAMWKNIDNDFGAPHPPLARAATRLRAAIQDPVERKSDSTIFGVMLLHFYEELAARMSQKHPSRRHMDGAMALLKQEAGSLSSSNSRGYLLGYLLNCEVSLITEAQASQFEDVTMFLQRNAIGSIPPTPRSILDLNGLSVAGIQHEYRATLVEPQTSFSKAVHSTVLLQRLDTIMAELDQWPHFVPNVWLPQSISVDSVESYAGICDVYPSAQIATQWNCWRLYQFKLLLLRLLLLRNLDPDFLETHKMDVNEQRESAERRLQELFDSICQSIPFYLGNRVTHHGMSDLQDPSIQLPSYHMFDPSSGAYLRYRGSEEYMSHMDHNLHIIVQGPFHAMMHLTQVVGLLRDDCGWLLDTIVPLPQRDWIQTQSARVRRLLGLQS